jgi:succinyl-CoA synthetase beta subunit
VARKKLSEFRAKSLINAAQGWEYPGVSLDAETKNWQAGLDNLNPDWHYVVKVDQAEKQRFKKGLVLLDRSLTDVTRDAQDLFGKGYRYVLVEPFAPHEASQERYLALSRTRVGTMVAISKSGGIDIESSADSIEHHVYTGDPIDGLALSRERLQTLVETFDKNYFSFLEINPLIIDGDNFGALDAAVEVDDEATFFESGWTHDDLRSPLSRGITKQEQTVKELNEQSQASFSLELINPDGSVWLLLSGGGASVVVADEVCDMGFGAGLGNYGEYSGNPNTEETQHYTEQVLSLLLQSKAPKKVLIIGGGVANFTDIKQTFKGVIAGLQTHQDQLQEQGVKVYVRRGGPHEAEGLAAIKTYLDQAGLTGLVAGPDLVLSEIVSAATQGLEA